jgi:hypothetical protein
MSTKGCIPVGVTAAGPQARRTVRDIKIFHPNGGVATAHEEWFAEGGNLGGSGRSAVGIWVGGPALEQGETVLWERAANRTQAGRRAVGGRLFLTGSRLLFEPNRVDAATGGKNWSAPLASIRSVSTEPRDWNLFSGGLRTRLRLDLDDGVELFAVNHLDEVVTVIRRAC